MNISYPDLSFYTSIQIVLFFINCTVSTLYFYWGAKLALLIYQEKTSQKKLLFSFISAMSLQTMIVYGISLINGMVNHKGALDIGIFQSFTKVMFPFAYFVLYILGIRVLKLSNYKSAKIMVLSYVYYVSCNMMIRIAGSSLFPKTLDPRGWNYLRDILMLLSGTLMIYIFYRFVAYAVNRYRLYIDLYENSTTRNIRHELIRNFGICAVVYTCISIAYYFTMMEITQSVLIFFICLAYLVISVARDHVKINKRRLANKDEHIAALKQSVESFRGVKHDFNNILQTYSGYLAIKDIESLVKYHNKVTNTTVSAGTSLDLSERLSENPSFFALVMNKLQRAHEGDVVLQVILSCEMRDIPMDELDFNRIMAILLDNAIESAVLTDSKRIGLTGQTKPDGSKFFIISNSILIDVNTEQLFMSGFTTKSGHMGQGLTQVRAILHQYVNVTFDITSYKGIFTVYLELKPNYLKQSTIEACAH